MGECLQNRLLWHGELERMDESFWHGKYQMFEFGRSLAKTHQSVSKQASKQTSKQVSKEVSMQVSK